MAPHNTHMTDRAEPLPSRRRRFAMPAVVLGLLGGHVVFILLAITLATGDRSFAVVPDYYQKAVAYDDRKAALAVSAALGWRVALEPGAQVTSLGERDVLVRLRDREGAAVSGAQVAVSGYHFSRADEPVSFELAEALPGQYVGRAPLGREGFWWFELTAVRGGEDFFTEFKQFVPAGEVAR